MYLFQAGALFSMKNAKFWPSPYNPPATSPPTPRSCQHTLSLIPHFQLLNIAVKRSYSRVKLTSIPLWLLPYPCHCRILPPCAEIALEFMPSTCSHCSAIWSHGALNPSLFTTLIDREYLIWFGEKFPCGKWSWWPIGLGEKSKIKIKTCTLGFP